MKVKDEFQGWKEVQDELFFDEYVDAGGKKMFGKMRIVRDGNPLIESVHSGLGVSARVVRRSRASCRGTSPATS